MTILTGFWSETCVVSHFVREVKLHPIEENVSSLEFILRIMYNVPLAPILLHVGRGK